MSFPSVPSPAFHHRLTFKLSLKRSQLLPNPGQHLATSVVWVQMQLAAWVWQKETDSWVQEEKQAAEEAPPIFIYLFIYFVPEPFILLCSLLRKSKGTSGRTEEAWVRAHGWYSSRYRVAVVWTLSCKACRWSSKCLSNIYQSRGASAACKRRWNSGGRNSHSVRSLSPRFSLCLSVSRLRRSFAMPATNTPFLFDLHALSCEHHRLYVCPWRSVFHVFIWLIGGERWGGGKFVQ